MDPLAERFRTALDLQEAGIQMMRLNLRRKYPDQSDRQVAERLRAWLWQLDEPVPEHHRKVPWPRR